MLKPRDKALQGEQVQGLLLRNVWDSFDKEHHLLLVQQLSNLCQSLDNVTRTERLDILLRGLLPVPKKPCQGLATFFVHSPDFASHQGRHRLEVVSHAATFLGPLGEASSGPPAALLWQSLGSSHSFSNCGGHVWLWHAFRPPTARKNWPQTWLVRASARSRCPPEHGWWAPFCLCSSFWAHHPMLQHPSSLCSRSEKTHANCQLPRAAAWWFPGGKVCVGTKALGSHLPEGALQAETQPSAPAFCPGSRFR